MPENSKENFDILFEAYINAGTALGLNQKTLNKILDNNHKAILQSSQRPNTSKVEIAKLYIRIYQSLYALFGGDLRQMNHWVHTFNSNTNGVPANQFMNFDDLKKVLDYLDAIRNKT